MLSVALTRKFLKVHLKILSKALQGKKKILVIKSSIYDVVVGLTH